MGVSVGRGGLKGCEVSVGEVAPEGGEWGGLCV